MKVRQAFGADDDSEPVMVPRSDKALVAVSPERVRRLREHMIKTLRELRAARHLEHVCFTHATGAYWFRGPCGAHGLLSLQGMVLSER